MKNAHGRVIHLVKLQTESITPPWGFSRFLNCTNGNKSRKASQFKHVTKVLKTKNIEIDSLLRHHQECKLR